MPAWVLTPLPALPRSRLDGLEKREVPKNLAGDSRPQEREDYAIPMPAPAYATWQADGSGASAGEEATCAFSRAGATTWGEVAWRSATIGSSAWGRLRAAAPRRATQKAAEARTQPTSKIAMPLIAALDVPCPLVRAAADQSQGMPQNRTQAVPHRDILAALCKPPSAAEADRTRPSTDPDPPPIHHNHL